jgi:hypothetical protein
MSEDMETPVVRVRLVVEVTVPRERVLDMSDQSLAQVVASNVFWDALKPRLATGQLSDAEVTAEVVVPRGRHLEMLPKGPTAGQALEEARSGVADSPGAPVPTDAATEPGEVGLSPQEEGPDEHEANALCGIAEQALEHFGRAVASYECALADLDGPGAPAGSPIRPLADAVKALGQAVGALAVLHPFDLERD